MKSNSTQSSVTHSDSDIDTSRGTSFELLPKLFIVTKHVLAIDVRCIQFDDEESVPDRPTLLTQQFSAPSSGSPRIESLVLNIVSMLTGLQLSTAELFTACLAKMLHTMHDMPLPSLPRIKETLQIASRQQSMSKPIAICLALKHTFAFSHSLEQDNPLQPGRQARQVGAPSSLSLNPPALRPRSCSPD